MRLVTLGILLVASAAAADPLPVRTVEVAVGASLYADGVGGMGETGAGPALEVAWGSDRTQLFGEGSTEWVSLDHQSDVHGRRIRGGGGVRWLPMAIGDRYFSADMIVEGTAGIARTRWDRGDVVARPDIGFGWGMQARYDRRGTRLGVRFVVRVVFAPDAHDDMAAVCRGRCMTPAQPRSAGLDSLVELSW